jgi:enoyl-CoA hydratase
MTFETIIYKKDQNVATIMLNRSDCLNAINLKMTEELDQVFTDIDVDRDIRVVILTGGEKAFSCGADVREIMTPEENHLKTLISGTSLPRLPSIMVKGALPMMEKLAKLGKPVIAAVSGPAIGGGCEIALACDLRIASSTATFGQGEINIGVIPMAGGTQRLPRLIGPARAKELLYFGNVIDAQEAYRIGLVNKVVGVESLFEEAGKWAKTLSKKPPLALKTAKACVDNGLQMNLTEALVYELKEGWLLVGTEDRAEGMKAFIEKRKPVFEGR